MPRFRSAPLTAACVSLSVATPGLAQRTDVIRGRVVGPDSAPLPRVTVSAISLPDSVVKKAGTSDDGAYTVTFINGSGRYVVSVAAIGFAPARKPVARQAEDTAAIVADFRLIHQAQALAGVRSVATRPRPNTSDAAGEGGVGASVAYTSSLGSGLSGDVTGDLTAALSMIPGLSIIPDPNGGLPTISAFGLGGDQNGFALNGMNFGGSQVPRDGLRAAAITGTYDPSLGGFSGVRLSLRMSPGSNVSDRTLHFTLDNPSLQWTTPVAIQLGTEYSQPVFSGTAQGPIVLDKVFYNVAYQVQERTSDLVSLASENGMSLQALGISKDSVQRLLQSLGPLGIPIRSSGIPSDHLSTSGALYTRVDYRPQLPLPGTSILQVDNYYVLASGAWRDNGGSSVGATSLPAFGSQSSHREGGVQGMASRYVLGSVLNETSVSLGMTEDHSAPYLDLPTARILLGSLLPDGTAGLSTLSVGGNSAMPTDSRTWSVEGKNETSWMTWDQEHSIKVTADGYVDHYAATQDASSGVFLYNSLADFTGNQPASFSRTLTGRAADGQGASGSLAIGDIYQPFALDPRKRQLRVQYALRAEVHHFDVRPAFDPQVDSLFGLRTDHVPNIVTLSPMAGFSKQFGDFAFAPGQTTARGTVNGGVREYQGNLATRSIDTYTRQTGLPSGTQQLLCVGDAVPTPTWSSYMQSPATIPAQCANGSAGSPQSLTSPLVSLFAPDYTPLRSWRGNLGVVASLSRRLSAGLAATYGLNTNQADPYDVNFNPMAQFSLSAEGNRSVYVAPSSIVPATGAVLPTESRVAPEYAQVTETRSDLESRTRQMVATLNVTPGAGNASAYWSLQGSYTYNDNTEQSRGFAGSTAGDPRGVTWSPSGFTSHHIVGLTFSYARPNWVSLTLQGIARSGIPYTPLVNADINGDGYINDRPFVFNPVTTADSTVAAGMKSLLAAAPGTARNCLERQIGTIMARNSCVGPWNSSLNFTAGLDAYRLGLGNRGQLNLVVANMLGAVDQLLHGANNLRNWGQGGFVDPTLLTVRGFDPTTNNFRYAVNPLFGSTSVSRNAFRAPFVFTLDLRLNVGPDRETSGIGSVLRPDGTASATVPNERQIKSTLLRNVNSPIDQMLRLGDSLSLTPSQIDTLNIINKRYLTTRDSAYGELAKYLDGMRGNYGGEEVRSHWHQALLSVYRAQYAGLRQAFALLTSEQLAHMPIQIAFYRAQYDISDEAVERRYRIPLISPP